MKDFIQESWFKIKAMDRDLRKLFLWLPGLFSSGLFMGFVQADVLSVFECFLLAILPFILLWTIIILILWKKDRQS